MLPFSSRQAEICFGTFIAMFIAFCLDAAGLAEARGTAQKWLVELANSQVT